MFAYVTKLHENCLHYFLPLSSWYSFNHSPTLFHSYNVNFFFVSLSVLHALNLCSMSCSTKKKTSKYIYLHIKVWWCDRSSVDSRQESTYSFSLPPYEMNVFVYVCVCFFCLKNNRDLCFCLHELRIRWPAGMFDHR